jgi:leucyl aminopeptidase
MINTCKFNTKTGNLATSKTSCLIIAVYDKLKLSQPGATINSTANNALKDCLKSGDLQDKLGSTITLYKQPGVSAERILLIHCGSKGKQEPSAWQTIGSSIADAIKTTGATSALCAIEDCFDHLKNIVTAIMQSIYTFNEFKTQNTYEYKLKEFNFAITGKQTKKQKHAISAGLAIGKGAAFARDLGNMPANICTPEYLAKEAKNLSKKYKSIATTILERRHLEKMKMGCFISVTQGSPNPPKLISMEYKGKKSAPTIVLVGKGITFDTGGNSLKPAASMVGMKYDMCGAASVFGALQAVAELKLPINVVGLVAAAENTPGGHASRPDDIVTSMAGLTVEILNTDAEGRLVLCDTLTYAEKFKPDAVIDIATLTGACVVALGRHHSGMYANNDKLASELLQAGLDSQDKCWHMPLTDDYQSQLDSNFADIANIGGPEAGSVTAACFLSRFTKNYNWAHLDVAGSACRFGGKEKAATGRPVPMLVEYLLAKC